MKDLVYQQNMLINVHRVNQADNEKYVYRPFPTVLTDVEVYIPEEVFWPRATDRHYQVDVIWNIHRQVLRQPLLNEAANYCFKPAVSGPFANILSFMAVNEYLLTEFAKQQLALPVLDNALVSETKDEYHLLVKIIDQHSRKVSGEQIAAALLNKHAQPLSWELFCDTLKKYLPQVERLKFLKQLLYRVFIDGEIHPNQFMVLNQDNQAGLAPFSGVIPKGVYEPNPNEELAQKTPANTPNEFWQLVSVMKVNPAVFKEAARDLLFQWTYVLPEFIDQLQPLVQGLRFKKPFIPLGASHAQTWVDYLKHQHRGRVKDLEALGWYADFNLPAPNAGYPVSQLDLFKSAKSGLRNPRQHNKRHTQRCDKAEKHALRSQLLLFL